MDWKAFRIEPQKREMKEKREEKRGIQFHGMLQKHFAPSPQIWKRRIRPKMEFFVCQMDRSCFFGRLFCEKQTKTMRKIFALILILPALATVGCASTTGIHSAAAFEGKTKTIRTTAYTSSERGGPHSAVGTRLKTGRVNSASADWSVYPVGTKFRIKQTGQIFVVDDYGSALVGTNTIDLYKPSNLEMRKWGVRKVDIEILEWGSSEKSLDILKERSRNRHVREMVKSLKSQVSSEDSEN